MYQIVGIERLNYTNKDGRQITGYRVHFMYDLPDRGGNDGKAVDSVFVSDPVFVQSGINVGDAAMPVFNKHGRCQGFMESQ